MNTGHVEIIPSCDRRFLALTTELQPQVSDKLQFVVGSACREVPDKLQFVVGSACREICNSDASDKLKFVGPQKLTSVDEVEIGDEAAPASGGE